MQTPEFEAYAGGPTAAYGLWPLVVVNSAVLMFFALSFTRPHTSRDWRSMGTFSAFLVAVFTEMYGFPLTIYVLSGWLGARYPAADIFSHQNGHLWQTLFGWSGDPHANPIHLVGTVLIGAGFVLIADAWSHLHRAQRSGGVATTGPYRYVRHPQYLGFIAIMVGFLIAWPTLPTLIMFPILLRMYARLARREESTMQNAPAAAAEGLDLRPARTYAEYITRTPAFLPHLPLGGRRGRFRPDRRQDSRSDLTSSIRGDAIDNSVPDKP